MEKLTERNAARDALSDLAEIDIEIAHLEKLLELRHDQRRELINYHSLNKK